MITIQIINLLLLLNLNSRVIDPDFPSHNCRLLQHILCFLLTHNMTSHIRFPKGQIPNMKVMNFLHKLNTLQLHPKHIHIDIFWSFIHNQLNNINQRIDWKSDSNHRKHDRDQRIYNNPIFLEIQYSCSYDYSYRLYHVSNDMSSCSFDVLIIIGFNYAQVKFVFDLSSSDERFRDFDR